MIDLHTHTHYSDGRYAPAELVEAAARKGLRALAITDHDTIRGSLEAAPPARAAGIELVPAIEMTTRWPGAGLPPGDVNVDLLGYFVDLENAEFRAFTAALLADLHDRIAACCERLRSRGLDITMDDLYAENPRYHGLVQLIRALQHRGLASDGKTADRLVLEVWEAGRQTAFTAAAAIEQIHLAGGVAVLAHPSIVRPGGRQLEARRLRELVDWGLDGIEVYHYRLDAAARAHFLALAREFNLAVTGGSDMHGWRDGFDRLGTEPVSEAMLEGLKDRANRRYSSANFTRSL